MANTLMSELGETPQRSGGDEELIPVLGDVAALAGMMVGILSTGKVVPIDADSATLGISFIGIMDRHPTVDYDTIVGDEILNNVIVPKSGRKYDCFIEDMGDTFLKGTPLTFGTTTAGSLMKVANASTLGTLNNTLVIDDTVDILAQPIVAYLDEKVISTQKVAHIRWA